MHECKYCLNTDPRTLYINKEHLICRACIGFRGQQQAAAENGGYGCDDSILTCSLTLTPYQRYYSTMVIEKMKTGSTVLEAVCGAGKSEMVLNLVLNHLKQGHKVGWAIPRRQVVLELHQRLQEYFPNNRVIAVCEGYTQEIVGDLIICTTHQLYHYHKYFDLLILDEVDAYPFSQSVVLKGFARQCVRGNTLFMSATLDEEFNQQVAKGHLHHVYCPIRPSLKLLSVLRERRFFTVVNLLRLAVQLIRMKEQVLLFVPTKKMAKKFSVVLGAAMITSSSADKETIIEQFRNGHSKVLITTTILERGVTFHNVSVIVWESSHKIFNVASLVQIAGRVGRGINSTAGTCTFYTNCKSREVIQCIENIKNANGCAKDVLQNFPGK